MDLPIFVQIASLVSLVSMECKNNVCTVLGLYSTLFVTKQNFVPQLHTMIIKS